MNGSHSAIFIRLMISPGTTFGREGGHAESSPPSHVHLSKLMIGAAGSPVTVHFSIHLTRAGKSCQAGSVGNPFRVRQFVYTYHRGGGLNASLQLRALTEKKASRQLQAVVGQQLN